MSANSIFSSEFVKSVGGFLANACSDGTAVTRPELGKQIRKLYGRKLDYTDLNMWLSSSVNMGLFNTDDTKFITKRGVSGGIVMVGAAKRAEAEAAGAAAPAPKATRKARAPKAAVAAPASTPVTAAPVETPVQA